MSESCYSREYRKRVGRELKYTDAPEVIQLFLSALTSSIASLANISSARGFRGKCLPSPVLQHGRSVQIYTHVTNNFKKSLTKHLRTISGIATQTFGFGQRPGPSFFANQHHTIVCLREHPLLAAVGHKIILVPVEDQTESVPCEAGLVNVVRGRRGIYSQG
jgi:hypothetical protein